MIKVINLYPTVTWMTFGYKIKDILVGYIFVSTLSSIESDNAGCSCHSNTGFNSDRAEAAEISF